MELLFQQKNIPEKIGVYSIIISGKRYVGSSINLKTRLNEHKKSLSSNRHFNKHLQRTFNKYGKENLYFEILYVFQEETIEKLELLKKEKEYIDLYSPIFNKKLDPTTQFNSITQSKKVYQFTKEGNLINEFISVSEAKRITGIKGIQHAANPKYKFNKSAGGFLWSYFQNVEKYENNSAKAKSKKITMYDLLGNKINTYDSISECVKFNFPNFDYTLACSNVSSCCIGKMSSFLNFQFAFGENQKITCNNVRNFPISQFDKNENLIKTWKNWGEIKKEFKTSYSFNKYVIKSKSKSEKTSEIFNFIWKKVM